MIVLCSLCLLINTVTIKASYPGYSHMTYYLQNAVTLDGNWTSDTEWTDGLQTSFGTNAVFRSKWFLVSFDPIIVNQYILIEILNDNTNDTGDYWQLCFDGDESGGTAPQVGDRRIDIVGHTTLIAYQGNGTGWTAWDPGATFQWKNSISTSPTSSAPHWICEIIISKVDFGIGPDYWLRVAVYDASNAAAGVQAWPPTSRDVPNDWGDIPYSMEPIPENLTFGGVVVLSSVAVLVGSYCMRKRPIYAKKPR